MKIKSQKDKVIDLYQELINKKDLNLWTFNNTKQDIYKHLVKGYKHHLILGGEINYNQHIDYIPQELKHFQIKGLYEFRINLLIKDLDDNWCYSYETFTFFDIAKT